MNFRVKGDLREFPFADNKGGTFFVTAKINGGALHYGDGWPAIENIDGDFAFRGKRMDIVAHRGKGQLDTAAVEEGVGGNEQSGGPIARDRCEGRIDLAVGAGSDNLNL